MAAETSWHRYETKLHHCHPCIRLVVVRCMYSSGQGRGGDRHGNCTQAETSVVHRLVCWNRGHCRPPHDSVRSLSSGTVTTPVMASVVAVALLKPNCSNLHLVTFVHTVYSDCLSWQDSCLHTTSRLRRDDKKLSQNNSRQNVNAFRTHDWYSRWQILVGLQDAVSWHSFKHSYDH